MLNANDFLLTKVSAQINKEQSTDPYSNSSFKSLKNLSSKKKGKYFEHIYQEYMESKGSVVEKPRNSDHDRIADGRKKEIKGSFLWGNGTHFRWQQIRPDQDYNDVVFIAVYPDRLEIYEADKETVRSAVEVQDKNGNWVYNQHGGKRVNSGAFFLDGFPSDYSWMKEI